MTSNTNNKDDLIEYLHPWCGKLFLIKARFLEIQGNPEMNCMLCPEIEPALCETAIKNFKNSEQELLNS